jgi:cytochrome c oxidase subunit 2
LDRLTEYLFPKQVSTFAQDIDNLFYFIFYTSLALLAIVTFGMIYLAIKYRFKKNAEVRLTSSTDHNSILESSFVIIPLTLVSITFVWGIKSYLNMVTVPNDAIEMKITGQSWYWTWDYPDGGPSNV